MVCFAKKPKDSSNSGWVTLSCVSKAQGLGGGGGGVAALRL